jgi:hypothetical protein
VWHQVVAQPAEQVPPGHLGGGLVTVLDGVQQPPRLPGEGFGELGMVSHHRGSGALVGGVVGM